MERAHHLFTAIFARSVLAQKTAAALLCRGPPNSGKWTHRRGVDEREHCSSRLPCGHQARTKETSSSRRWQNYQTWTIHLQRAFRHRLSAVANSANRAALRDGTSCPSEVSTVVRINQHSGVRVSGNMQPFPSLPHAIILSVCCTTTHAFSVPFPALLVSRFCVLTHTRVMAAAHDKRTDDGASPENVHPYAHRYAAKTRAEIQREESREWTVLSKEETRVETTCQPCRQG